MKWTNYGACPSGGIGRRTGLKILRVLKPVPVQVRPRAPLIYFYTSNVLDGRLAQLVRAPALQAGGHRFESYIAHHFCRHSVTGSATDL